MKGQTVATSLAIMFALVLSSAFGPHAINFTLPQNLQSHPSGSSSLLPAADAQSSVGAHWPGTYKGTVEEISTGLTTIKFTDSGQFAFTVFPNYTARGSGSGHLYYSLVNTAGQCMGQGDTAHTFPLYGYLNPTAGNISLSSAGAATPSTFTETDNCDDTHSSEQGIEVNLAPLIGSPNMKLQQGATWSYYNAYPMSGGSTTDNYSVTIGGSNCPSTLTSKFEPVQAVWQDDTNFADSPGKELTIVDNQHITAELPMVVGKPTLLFGIKDARDHINVNGTVSGSQAVPTEIRFTLSNSGGDNVIDTFPLGNLPVEGGCGPPQDVITTISTTDGIPKNQAFTIDTPGAYQITMELVETGNGKVVQGTQVILSGKAESIPGLKMEILPVYLSKSQSGQGENLVSSALIAAVTAENRIPDFYPWKPSALHVDYAPSALNWTDLSSEAANICKSTNGRCYSAWLLETTIQKATAVGFLTNGSARVIVLLTPTDFASLGVPNAAAFTVSTKVIIAQTSYLDPLVIAHELAHTLPTFPWLGGTTESPGSACGVPYHNDLGKLGSGFQITADGVETRAPEEQVSGMMEGAGASWIEQCTYSHLITALTAVGGKGDPLVLGVRGWIFLNGSSGGFSSGYSFMSNAPDLNGTENGNYSLVFKDQNGATLAEYHFNMTFATEDGYPVEIDPFAFRIPMPQTGSELDLLGPNGLLLASEKVPSGSPSLIINSPPAGATVNGNDNTSLTASWKGTGESNLTYSVVVSPDNGTHWYPLVLDTHSTSAAIPSSFLSASDNNLLRVFVTDGFHTQNSTVHFAASGVANSTSVLLTQTAIVSSAQGLSTTTPSVSNTSSQAPESNSNLELTVGLVVLFVVVGTSIAVVIRRKRKV
jgi:hypothetical protein